MIFEGKKATDKWYPVRLVDAIDCVSPKAGKVFGDITCKYGYEGATEEATHTVTTAEWREQGDGNYWLLMGAGEFASEGKYIGKVECAGCRDENFCVEVRDLTIAELIDAVGAIPTTEPDAAGTAASLHTTTDALINGVPAVNVTQIDGEATADYSATLKLKQLDIQNSAGTAFVCKATGSDGVGLDLAGNGAGQGLLVTGGATGHAIEVVGGSTSGDGIFVHETAGCGARVTGKGAYAGLFVEGGATGHGLEASGGGTSGHGIQARSAISGHGLYCEGAGNGHGIGCQGDGSGEGLSATGGATGHGVDCVGGASSGSGLRAAASGGNAAGMTLVRNGLGKDLDTDEVDVLLSRAATQASVCTEARLAELDAANLPADVDAIPTTAMRGTDSAALASVCTETRLAELDAANLPTDIAAIPTTAMRGTDDAALASVCTEARLAELAAANLPTDIAAIPTTPMRGTDSAALASVCTETRLAELDAANLPADIDAIPTTAMRGTDSAALASVCTEGRLAELDAANLPTDVAAIPTTEPDAAGTAAALHTTTDALVGGLTDVTAAEVKTAMEADGSKLDHVWEATEDDGGVRRFTENALEQAPSGTGASAAVIADAVADELLAEHVIEGSVAVALSGAAAAEAAIRGADDDTLKTLSDQIDDIESGVGGVIESLGDAISDNAAGPKKVTGDSGSVEQHSIEDQLKAERFRASKAALTKRSRGLRVSKIFPPGSSE